MCCVVILRIPYKFMSSNDELQLHKHEHLSQKTNMVVEECIDMAAGITLETWLEHLVVST